MLRHLAGLALLGLLALFVIRVAFGLFGLILGLAVTVGVLAIATCIGYSILQMLSPGTAAKLHRLIDRSTRSAGSDTGIPRP